jgi:hypothetical protein
MRTPFHAGFSLYINLLADKKNSRRCWMEGYLVCAIKHNGEIWSLDKSSNTGAVFTADGRIHKGICTDGQAVRFVKPDALTADEHARLIGMFPKKL